MAWSTLLNAETQRLSAAEPQPKGGAGYGLERDFSTRRRRDAEISAEKTNTRLGKYGCAPRGQVGRRGSGERRETQRGGEVGVKFAKPNKLLGDSNAEIAEISAEKTQTGWE